MSNEKSESAPCAMFSGTSNLDIENVISNTSSSFVDVDRHEKSEVSHNGTFLKFLNTRSVLNIFGRGFLAEPVLRDQEESYRYLMALDYY